MTELIYLPFCECERATAVYNASEGQYKCKRCGLIIDDVAILPATAGDTGESESRNLSFDNY